jgi:hypothetical protein
MNEVLERRRETEGDCEKKVFFSEFEEMKLENF